VKNFFAVWSYVLTAGFTARGPGTTGRLYLFSEVFDLKPTSGLYLKNSAHLSNFLTPRTVSVISQSSSSFVLGRFSGGTSETPPLAFSIHSPSILAPPLHPQSTKDED
jgi:hypothetical protein